MNSSDCSQPNRQFQHGWNYPRTWVNIASLMPRNWNNRLAINLGINITCWLVCVRPPLNLLNPVCMKLWRILSTYPLDWGGILIASESICGPKWCFLEARQQISHAWISFPAHCTVQHWFRLPDHLSSHTLHRWGLRDNNHLLGRMESYLEEDILSSVCSHLARSHPNVRCVYVGLMWVSTRQLC